MAIWTGFAVPDLDAQIPGGSTSRARRALFFFFNWPWSSIAWALAVIVWGSHFPPLSRDYVAAGLAGAAAVARVAPSLTEATYEGRIGLRRSVSQAAHASRRAMGWSLVSFLTLPWIGTHQIRLDWLALAVPASFAGRALWEPWWWKVSWVIAGWLS
ncbi:hypothetical protein [Sulfobacillus harzensis]|uniref:Uncharacterized protein n=1 Tax=Sulfobacillus harzensis TaxID=2729629 RepID=A0A7Y0L7U5_9FIRM|nr:hypothetical protein [Sulfobacillus harzensis]NMP23514.1 hypothetical protein [Sulfobacillus harzensis]